MDLLLDTLCDLLGTLVLIACLLVVTMQEDGEGDVKKSTGPVEPEAGILEEKRLEHARAELDGLQKLRAQLQSEDDPSTRPLITELLALRKTAEVKRQERARQDELAGKMAEQKLRDSGSEIARLREQDQELERKLGIMNKDTEAARQRHAALEKELADLQLELESVNDLKVEKLRFPREREVNKPPAPVILRYGQVFPLYNPDGSPSPYVKQATAADGTFTAMVQQGQGLNPAKDARRLRELLPHLLGKDRYLTIYVYPDSFTTFRDLKKIIFELGLEYGLELCTEHRALIFSATGSKPAPL
ncbi:hypothetical protein [Brevifollis gellanilyticus]|nr:hypothetical protein [Brevifollis gellanilyticus]